MRPETETHDFTNRNARCRATHNHVTADLHRIATPGKCPKMKFKKLVLGRAF
jgi:hypothetical protein